MVYNKEYKEIPEEQYLQRTQVDEIEKEADSLVVSPTIMEFVDAQCELDTV